MQESRVAPGVSDISIKPYSGDWPEVVFVLTAPEGQEALQKAWEQLDLLLEQRKLPKEGTWPIEPGPGFELKGLGQTIHLVEK